MIELLRELKELEEIFQERFLSYCNRTDRRFIQSEEFKEESVKLEKILEVIKERIVEVKYKIINFNSDK